MYPPAYSYNPAHHLESLPGCRLLVPNLQAQFSSLEREKQQNSITKQVANVCEYK